MRLDHLLSRESDIARKQVFRVMDKGSSHSIVFNFEGPALETECAHTQKHGGIAQLGEHLLCKQGVKGSNPFISTNVGQ